jgi:tetratricopeptide (TPR) repeat protein
MNRNALCLNPALAPALALAAALIGAPAVAADASMDQAVLGLQHQWEQATYQTPESARGAALTKLDNEAKTVAAHYPGRAEPLIWEAISLSSHAKVEGGLTGLGMAKQARDLLEQAAQIDPKALNGSAYSSLGALYAKVPGWPMGFGDKDKAEANFKKALAINPNGIDPNYLYADFLFDQQRYPEAKAALERAAQAPARPNRPLADQGRGREVGALMTQVRAKLGVGQSKAGG